MTTLVSMGAVTVAVVAEITVVTVVDAGSGAILVGNSIASSGRGRLRMKGLPSSSDDQLDGLEGFCRPKSLAGSPEIVHLRCPSFSTVPAYRK